MSRRVAEGVSADIGLKNSIQFSASFDITQGVQDYDLQATFRSTKFSGSVGNKKILVKKVYYKTPHAMWRFWKAIWSKRCG